MQMFRASFCILVVLVISNYPVESVTIMNQTHSAKLDKPSREVFEHSALNCRKHSAILTDFGAVGDGKTLNTKAFRDAISNLTAKAADGGIQLIVPKGKWLTGSFNLTSHFTLHIQEGATILASQDESEYPMLPALPSYGYTRPASLIYGRNLTDVVITGNKGTIHGQGKSWWVKYGNDGFKSSKFFKKISERQPVLIEIQSSENVQISNIHLIDPPMWGIHPVYCRNVIIKNVKIATPIDSPNTDGINPDSCYNTLIEDCFVVSGNDCVGVKSGIDQYGTTVGIATKMLAIRRLTCISPNGAGVALGSEMAGGIEGVRIEDVTLYNTKYAVKIETAEGRGGHIYNVWARRITVKTSKYVFLMNGGPAPDGHVPKAMPLVTNINFRDITAENVTTSARLFGMTKNPFSAICMSNVSISLSKKPSPQQFYCADIVEGVSRSVKPEPFSLLPDKYPGVRFECPFAQEIPIESLVLQNCGGHVF